MLTVEKPTFVTSPEDQSVHDYSSATTRVRVHGIPQPTLEWRKDGKLIDYSAVNKSTQESLYKVEFAAISEDHITSEFEILHFRSSDVGKVCRLNFKTP